ncbi:MAG TPA: hypothetical protein VH601_05360 [Bryobacteraceae bacterium]|jgi:hypothetical protein
MNASDHLTNDLLVRAIDDELSPGEILLVESHLPDCEICKRRHAEILRLSDQIESLAAIELPEARPGEREALASRLEACPERTVRLETRRKRVRAIWWSAGIAAAILLAVLFGLQPIHFPANQIPANHAPADRSVAGSLYLQDATLQVDGESFIPLPYSNPDLPVSAPHIVEMQVPVSSLAGVGLVFEPISHGISGADDSVLADVLMGVDGQPLGIHVLSVD